MKRCPVHEVCRALVRAKEENFAPAEMVNDLFVWQQEIEQTVHKLLEGNTALVLMCKIEQDNALRTALRNVLVLAVLCVGKTVAFVKDAGGVVSKLLRVVGADKAHPTTRDVLEAHVEATKLWCRQIKVMKGW
jgi:hypothetical protein